MTQAVHAIETPAIKFNVPFITGREITYIADAVGKTDFGGDGPYGRRCEDLLERRLKAQRVLLCPSGTHALEMAALLLDIQPGDEVIMPSFTFVSTANAFVLRGATVVFVDITADTLNIDVGLIERAITKRTKAVVAVHYAGVSCDMGALLALTKAYNLFLVEDAAQGIGSTYNGQALGTFGSLGCMSFHETKNIQCGEGGALIINDPALSEKAEVLREKGTNRAKFYRGEIDKYTWVSLGSSFLSNEFTAAFLLAQLEDMDVINEKRLSLWGRYAELLENSNIGIETPRIPDNCQGNGHIFWIKCSSAGARAGIMQKMKAAGIHTTFHYVPLHDTEPGRKFSRFHGSDDQTTSSANRLIRLPLYPNLENSDVEHISSSLMNAVRASDA